MIINIKPLQFERVVSKIRLAYWGGMKYNWIVIQLKILRSWIELGSDEDWSTYFYN